MNKNKAIKALIKYYPNVTVSLNYESPFELLVCLILAAQCTDKRVNEVTEPIFKKYNTPEDFVKIELKDLENMIHSCGFYRNKAKNIKKASQQLIDKYNSQVPNNMDDLQTLAGIGRKSANCIMADAFHKPCGIAIDTHAKRICNRIGISTNSNPLIIEQDLISIIDKKDWQQLNLILVTHGREICDSRNPKCEICPCRKYCEYNNKS